MPETASKDPLARLAEQSHWITPETERDLQAVIKETVHSLGGNRLRRALHGDWLHEPLHAILTDVPVGSWTATISFDAIAALLQKSSVAPDLSAKLDAAADATLLLGLVGAVGAAITGMNDWSEIDKPAPRKIGLVHAALNLAATSFFIGSAIFRARPSEAKAQDRAIGRSLAAVGYVLVSASAHLGGSLVYEHGIGVANQPGDAEVTESMHG